MTCKSCNERRERAKVVLQHAHEATRRFYASVKDKSAQVADKAVEKLSYGLNSVITPRQEINPEDFNTDLVSDKEYNKFIQEKDNEMGNLK